MSKSNLESRSSQYIGANQTKQRFPTKTTCDESMLCSFNENLKSLTSLSTVTFAEESKPLTIQTDHERTSSLIEIDLGNRTEQSKIERWIEANTSEPEADN